MCLCERESQTERDRARDRLRKREKEKLRVRERLVTDCFSFFITLEEYKALSFCPCNIVFLSLQL